MTKQKRGVRCLASAEHNITPASEDGLNHSRDITWITLRIGSKRDHGPKLVVQCKTQSPAH